MKEFVYTTIFLLISEFSKELSMSSKQYWTHISHCSQIIQQWKDWSLTTLILTEIPPILYTIRPETIHLNGFRQFPLLVRMISLQSKALSRYRHKKRPSQAFSKLLLKMLTINKYYIMGSKFLWS